MTANGTPRHLASTRKIAWAAAAYGIELMWDDQSWLLSGFTRLTGQIGRAVAGNAKMESAIRAVDSPPPRLTLDRRRARFLAATLVSPADSPAVLFSLFELQMTLARSGWLTTADDQGQGPSLAQDYKNLGF
jgi:hypothetical protein